MASKSQGGDAASPALASLAGDFRFVSTSEPPRGSALHDGVIKLVTGGAPLKVRHLGKDLFEYVPRWKIILECNALPIIPGADEGIWRRCKLLLWRVQLKKREMDGELENKIAHGEGSGVLNWLAGGALAYLEQGLADSAEAKDDLASYRAGANIFGEWAAARLILEPAALIEQKELRTDYEAFCEHAGYEPAGVKAFLDELTNLQITRQSKLSSRGRNVMRKGARLRTEDDPPAGEGGEADGAENAVDYIQDENDFPVFQS